MPLDFFGTLARAYDEIYAAPKRARLSIDLGEVEPRLPMQTLDSATNISELAPDVVVVPKHKKTVTIFDWDDTLLSTTFLKSRQWGVRCSGEDDAALEDAVDSAYQVLKRAIDHGETFIITNGHNGWVQMSASKYAPELLPLLAHVTIISARSEYEFVSPGDARAWKRRAFRDVCVPLESVFVNLIAVGDSFHDIEAAWAMGAKLKQSLLKTVKLQTRPTANELHFQLETVAKQFDQIVSHPCDLNVRLGQQDETSAL